MIEINVRDESKRWDITEIVASHVDGIEKIDEIEVIINGHWERVDLYSVDGIEYYIESFEYITPNVNTIYLNELSSLDNKSWRYYDPYFGMEDEYEYEEHRSFGEMVKEVMKTINKNK